MRRGGHGRGEVHLGGIVEIFGWTGEQLVKSHGNMGKNYGDSPHLCGLCHYVYPNMTVGNL